MAAEGLTNIFGTTVGLAGIAAGTGNTSLPVIRAAPTEIQAVSFAIIVNANTATAEIMEVIGGQSTTTWTVVRASEPLDISGVRTQTAFIHNSGEPIQAVISAAFQNRLYAKLYESRIMAAAGAR